MSSESLRFDFTHFSAIKPNELKRIEELANEKILENLCVTTKEMSIKEARKEKVIALFGEKYGEKVRMVEIDKISKELCGGTHIKATGELGSFKIIGEESVAAGVRRITAVTGMPAYKMVLKTEELIETIALKLKTSSTDIQQK